MIYDITRTISPQLAVWPGDTPFSFTQQASLAEGDSVNLTTLNMSAHTGTHIDAPWHFQQVDMHPADLPLEPYIGPAHVVSVDWETGGLTPEHVAGIQADRIERLLVHTRLSENPVHEFPEDFPYPTVPLIDWLADRGCVLLGVDGFSMAAFTSKDMAGHHRLRHHNIAILETITLAGVPDGEYELIALPLKIADVCGSPVRAILRTKDSS